MKIGFIGLGIMGKPMAKNLLKAGYELTVFDLNKAAVEEVVAAGAKAAESACEAAKGAEVVLTMLPNSPHVKAVMLGENGVASVMEKGSTFIDMSSINPIASREIEQELSKYGVEMLDAAQFAQPSQVDCIHMDAEGHRSLAEAVCKKVREMLAPEV